MTVYILGEIEEITIVGTYDRGKPNQERIVLHVNRSVNLASFGIMLGVRADSGIATPIRDNLLWFGNGMVYSGDWLFVYTGPGEPKVTTIPNTNERLYSIHWGRDRTILHHEAFVPILFRMDAVQIPREQPTLPQTQTP